MNFELDASYVSSYIRNFGEQEFAKITAIDYEIFGQLRLCSLKVNFINGIYYIKLVNVVCFPQLDLLDVNGLLTGESFILKYHDVENVADFLILRPQYDLAIKRHWQPGERFRNFIGDTWLAGEIVKREACSATFPDSVFRCYIIK